MTKIEPYLKIIAFLVIIFTCCGIAVQAVCADELCPGKAAKIEGKKKEIEAAKKELNKIKEIFADDIIKLEAKKIKLENDYKRKQENLQKKTANDLLKLEVKRKQLQDDYNYNKKREEIITQIIINGNEKEVPKNFRKELNRIKKILASDTIKLEALMIKEIKLQDDYKVKQENLQKKTANDLLKLEVRGKKLQEDYNKKREKITTQIEKLLIQLIEIENSYIIKVSKKYCDPTLRYVMQKKECYYQGGKIGEGEEEIIEVCKDDAVRKNVICIDGKCEGTPVAQ